jgi:hypothetical protein
MMVWTPIPESAGETVANTFSSGFGLLAWRLLLIAVGSSVILAMVVAGGILGIIAGLIVGIALGTVLREVVSDLWHFNFYEV